MDIQKKLCIITSFDSFIKASIPIMESFKQNGCSVEIFVQKFDNQEDYLPLFNQETHQINNLLSPKFIKEAFSADYLLISLPGGAIKYIVNNLSKMDYKKRPVVFAGYCGLVYEKFEIGVNSRSNVDVYYVNSKKDQEHFSALMRKWKRENNIYLTGLPLFDKYSKIEKLEHTNKNGVVFAAQPTVPHNYIDRKELLFGFINLAKSHPNRNFYFKPRGSIKEKTFHTELYHYQDLIKEYPDQLPSNFSLTEESIQELFHMSEVCLSISSTALIEAHLMGLKIGVLTDFGIYESFGNNFFNDSGIQTNFQRLSEDFDHLNIKADWLDFNLEISGNNASRLYEIVSSKAHEISNTKFRNYKDPLYKRVHYKLKRLLHLILPKGSKPH